MVWSRFRRLRPSGDALRHVALTAQLYVSGRSLLWAAIGLAFAGARSALAVAVMFPIAVAVVTVIETLTLQITTGLPLRFVTAKELFALRRTLAERIFRGEVDVETAAQEYRNTVGVCVERDPHYVNLFAQAYLARLIHEEAVRVDALSNVIGKMFPPGREERPRVH